MASLIVKNMSTNKLSILNEGVDENGSKKYIFEGPFTVCGVKNRNERIYDESEVLKHLSYLRDKIKKEGCILGELDHPEGRFEIYLKDVSHKIIDLWYVPEKKTVMGKLELLDTDNGRKVKAIVDAGCPLFVSSRAAGTVGANSHVSIQQIFTYDIVATPGFEQCRLDAVSESMKGMITSFINESLESEKKNKNVNKASKYGVLDEHTVIIETEKVPEIKESKNENIDMANLTKPLVNEDIQVKVSPEKAQELGLKLGGGDNNDTSSEEVKPSVDDILEITPTYAEQDKSAIQDIQPEFKTADSDSQNTEGQTETSGENQVENENPFMMESCKGKGKKKSKKNEVQKEEYSEEKDLDEDEVEECCTGKKCKKGKKMDECGDNISEEDEVPNPVADGKKGSETDKVMDKNNKNEEKNESYKMMRNLSERKKKIQESDKSSMDYYNSVLEEYRMKMDTKQTIVNAYPFSISLSESNFAKFASFSEQDKKKCADYIFEQGIFDIRQINDQFMRPLVEAINSQKNYIRLADSSDLELYRNAPQSLKESIDKMAEIYILENKSDVDEFWSRTGIRNFVKERVNNEAFVQNYNDKMTVSEDENDTYGDPLINWVASQMK